MSAALAIPPLPRLIGTDTDNAEHYEIIDGERKELPPMSAHSSAVASILSFHLSSFGIRGNTGRAFTEMLIRLPLPVDRNRRPDIVFVPYDRWPRERLIPDTNAWDVLPDLCVEVISPNDLIEDIVVKTGEYFQAGVRLVWIVYPRQQLVDVLESYTRSYRLTRTDVLEGGSVLPGFQLPLVELFPTPIPPIIGE